ncbi:hypothetical protein [Massilia sp.]|uniref:hypothetical protein n=1 Tax=Massilia sp. TaxID=1882437 RepID=UPI00352DCCF6
MMGYLEMSLVVVLWMVHFGLLFLINADVRERGLGAKYAVTIFTFYTLTLLVPFYNHEHFDYVVNYVPSSTSLFLGVCADLSMLAAVRWSFPVQVVPNMMSGSQIGFALLVAVAAVAQVIDIVMNRELLLLPKELYIEAEKVPNLLVFSIPAQLILLGGALYSPFKKAPLRLLIAVQAIVATVLSVVQGYRGVALMVVLHFVYRRWPRLSPLVPTLLMTVAGELSNPIKYFVGGLLLNDKFDAVGMLDYYGSHLDLLVGLSGEQKAIVSNLVLGMKELALGDPILELRNLFPLTNALFGNITATSATRLGELAGVGYGQGTAYSFVLFIAEAMVIAPLMMLGVTRMMRLLGGTPLAFVSWTVFFSLMRDTPAFWSGELKMSVLLTLIVIAVSFCCGEYSRLYAKDVASSHGTNRDLQ